MQEAANPASNNTVEATVTREPADGSTTGNEANSKTEKKTPPATTAAAVRTGTQSTTPAPAPDAPLPAEIQQVMSKSTYSFTTTRKLYVDTTLNAVEAAVANVDHPAGVKYLKKMLPNICEIFALQQWNDISNPPVKWYEDQGTTLHNSGVRVLEGAVNGVLALVKRGTADLLKSYIHLCSPERPLYRDKTSTAEEFRQRMLQWGLKVLPEVLQCLHNCEWVTAISVFDYFRLCGVEKQIVSEGVQTIIRRLETMKPDEVKTAGNWDDFTRLVQQLGAIGDEGTKFASSVGPLLRNAATTWSKSEKFAERRAALGAFLPLASNPNFLTGNDSAPRCEFLDTEGVLTDLFGERAHERLILEAIPLLEKILMTEQRIDIVVHASLNRDDAAERSSVNTLLASLCNSLPEAQQVLHLLGKTQEALLAEQEKGPAFDLFKALAMAKRQRGQLDEYVLMNRGLQIAQGALRLVCSAASSDLARKDEEVYRTSLETLHALLSDGEYQTQQQQRDFVLAHCVQQIENTTSTADTRAAYAILKEVIEMHPQQHSYQTTRSQCIKQLQEKFQIVEKLLSNIGRLADSNARAEEKGDKLTHSERWQQLELLRFILEKSVLELDEEQVRQLWGTLGGATEIALRWFRLVVEGGLLVTREALTWLFQEALRADPTSLPLHGFNFFAALFADCNLASSALEAAFPIGSTPGRKLLGGALVGRRISVKTYPDESFLPGTVTAFTVERNQSTEWHTYTVNYEANTRSQNLEETYTDWTLIEDECSAQLPVLAFNSCSGWENLEGKDFLWAVAIGTADDAVAEKAAQLVLSVALALAADPSRCTEVANEFLDLIFEVFVPENVTEPRVQRALRIIQLFLERCCTQNALPHGARLLGHLVDVTLEYETKMKYHSSYGYQEKAIKNNVTLTVHSGLHLGGLVSAFEATEHTWIPRPLQLASKDKLIEGRLLTLSELGVLKHTTFVAQYNTKPPSSLLPVYLALAETGERNERRYHALFRLLNRSEYSSSTRQLLWQTLMAMPTHAADFELLARNADAPDTAEDRNTAIAAWARVFGSGCGVWRSAYVLQIVDMLLQPTPLAGFAVVPAEVQADADGWRNKFFATHGLEQVRDFLQWYSQNQTTDTLIDQIALPIFARILRFCLKSSLTKVQPLDTEGEVATDEAKETDAHVHRTASGTRGWPTVHVEGVDVFDIVEFATVQLVNSVQLCTTGSETTVRPALLAALIDLVAVINLVVNVPDPAGELATGFFESQVIQQLITNVLLVHPSEEVRAAVYRLLREFVFRSQRQEETVALLLPKLQDLQALPPSCGQYFLLYQSLPEFYDFDKHAFETTGLCKTGDIALDTLMSDTVAALQEPVIQGLFGLVLQLATASTSFGQRVLAEGLPRRLLDYFLMRSPQPDSDGQWTESICQTDLCRGAAWQLLSWATQKDAETTAAFNTYILYYLRDTRDPANVDGSLDWSYSLAVGRRGNKPYVGMHNPGARCYINSMIQQLNNDPWFHYIITEATLLEEKVDKDAQQAADVWNCDQCTMENGWDAERCLTCDQGARPQRQAQQEKIPHGEVLFQLQRTFRFLDKSKLSTFDAVALMKGCRDIGMHKPIEVQNDTTEYFFRLLDRLEKEVGGEGPKKALANCFCVRMLSQLVSAECEHCKPIRPGPFERALPVNVVGLGSLEEALFNMNRRKLITGGNRVECEQCTVAKGQKVKVAMWQTQSMDGSSLPDTIVFNLNRFSVTGASASNVKINDYFSFPMTLDLQPYCTVPPEVTVDTDDMTFELKGVVIHAGQAGFGHYYSLVKHQPSGQWYRLDDERVTLYDPARIPEDCFGGLQVSSNWYGLKEKRPKSSSAFVIVYGRRNRPAVPVYSCSNPVIAKLDDEVRDTNEQVLRRRWLFDAQFIREVLAACERVPVSPPMDLVTMAVLVFIRVACRLRGRPNFEAFSRAVAQMLEQRPEVCSWLLGQARAQGWVGQMLVECSEPEVRLTFARLLVTTCRTAMHATPEELDTEIVQFLQALLETVPIVTKYKTRMEAFADLCFQLADETRSHTDPATGQKLTSHSASRIAHEMRMLGFGPAIAGAYLIDATVSTSVTTSSGTTTTQQTVYKPPTALLDTVALLFLAGGEDLRSVAWRNVRAAFAYRVSRFDPSAGTSILLYGVLPETCRDDLQLAVDVSRDLLARYISSIDPTPTLADVIIRFLDMADGSQERRVEAIMESILQSVTVSNKRRLTKLVVEAQRVAAVQRWRRTHSLSPLVADEEEEEEESQPNLDDDSEEDPAPLSTDTSNAAVEVTEVAVDMQTDGNADTAASNGTATQEIAKERTIQHSTGEDGWYV